MLDTIYKISVIVFSGIVVMVSIFKFLSLSTRGINWMRDFSAKLSEKRKNKYLKKRAIKYKIEKIVNTTVFDLQKELPDKWVRKMHLKWVDQGSSPKLKSGQKIIRVEPSDRQDYNIINGVYHYFHNCLFPKTFEVIPSRIINALSIKLSLRTLINSDRGAFLSETFKETVLKREANNDVEMLKYYEPFVDLDEKGFLTGALVREIDSIASKVVDKANRSEFEKMVQATMAHMVLFTTNVRTGGATRTLTDDEWGHSNEVHTYRFLLAKRQRRMKVDSHLFQAQKAFSDGVDRYYVFGTSKDIPFTTKLIARIGTQTGFRHVQTFDLDRDFNSNEKGIGALFVKDHSEGE